MGRVTILDGGMGRELQRVGAPFRQPEWSALALIESPEHVTQVHENYVATGAQMITTNAYAVVPFHIGQERFDADGHRLAALAGRLARSVADAHPGVRVAGCLPPPLGSYLHESFVADEARPILAVLVEEQEPFVDLWLAETQSSTAEVELAAAVVRERSSKPLWVSFSLADSLEAGAAQLRSGESITRAVRTAEEAGAEALLFNCSAPEVMESAVLEAVGLSSLPVGVYANAFVDNDHSESPANEGLSDIRNDLDPETYTDFARRWVEAGATLVGGCCGIGPAHVGALSGEFGNR